MATLLCNTDCGTITNPPSSYYTKCDDNFFLRYGYPGLVLVKCDVNIPDPTDVTAWEALVASGDIAAYPCGPLTKIDIPAPTETTAATTCGGDIVVKSVYTLTVTTYQRDANNLDFTYHKDILSDQSNLRAMWFDCHGNLTATDEYVAFMNGVTGAAAPVGNPGFPFTVSSKPHLVSGDGDLGSWVWSLDIELAPTEIFCQSFIPGLQEAILV